MEVPGRCTRERSGARYASQWLGREQQPKTFRHVAALYGGTK
jgi:hypothetical protein